jgi:hypothetical protein
MLDKKKVIPKYDIRESKKGMPYKIMVVNSALKNYQFKDEYPWYLWIKIELKAVSGPNNMPTNNEAQILNNIEDHILSIIEKECNVQFVGRVTENGNRELFYYIDNPEITSKTIESYFKKTPIREIEYYIEKDPNWKIVNFFYS